MKKITKIIIAVCAVIVIVSAFLIYYVFIQKRNEVKNEPANEAEIIMENNKELLDQAKNSNVKKVEGIEEGDHIWGDNNASVQMIVYNDFESPFCADFYRTLKEAKNIFGEKISIVFRHFPLRFNSNALTAAMASECASEQGKFWEMSEKIFANNESGNMNAEKIIEDAAGLGLNKDEFVKCLDDEKYKDKIQQQVDEAKEFGVIGAPSSFLNGQSISGAYPLDDFTDTTGQQKQGLKNIINTYIK